MQEKLLYEKSFDDEEQLLNQKKLKNEELLKAQHKSYVPENIIKELSCIVEKYQKYQTPQITDNHSSHYQDLYQKDPESFQTQYSIQKIPGNIKEAQQKTKNMTIKQIYLHKKSINIDWIFVNIYQEKYILEKYGLGVPLLLSQIKMIIFILYFIFFLNLYDGFQQLGFSNTYEGQQSKILGGLALVDIIKIPNIYMSSASLLVWLGFSYFLKIYIKRICEQDDELHSQEINQSDQLILKYFEKGLNQQQVEQILNIKLNEFCERMKTKLPQQFSLQVSSVIPIQNLYKINKQIQKINKIYTKILQHVNENYKAIFQSERINQIDSNIFSSIDVQNKDFFEKKESQSMSISQKNQVEQINQEILPNNSNENLKLNQDSLQQLNKQFNQVRTCYENDNGETTDTQKSSPKKIQCEIDNKLFQDENTETNIVYKYNIEQISNTNTIDDYKKQSLQNQNLESKFNKDDQVFENLSEIQENIDEQNINIQVNYKPKQKYSINTDDLSQGEIINFYQDDINNIYLRCKQLLEQTENRQILKLQKLILKYHNQKVILKDLQEPNKSQSSSYILRCQNTQQKEIIQYILKPRSSIVSFFQKCKYLFRSKRSLYTLNRIETSKTKHLNVNWNTIGISYQRKIGKQFYIRILGTFQFLISFFIIYIIYFQKLDNEFEESSFSVYMYKFLFAISQSSFYLINEKIFELYSKHMVASLKSKTICLQMNNYFFFYCLSYIIFPLFTTVILCFFGFVVSQVDQTTNPFITQSPFKILYTNYIACSIFSLKVSFQINFNSTIILI